MHICCFLLVLIELADYLRRLKQNAKALSGKLEIDRTRVHHFENISPNALFLILREKK